MDLEFTLELMEKTAFPVDAKDAVLASARKMTERLLAADFEELLDHYGQNGFRAEAVDAEVDALAERAGMPQFTLWLLVLIQWAKRVKPLYAQRGAGEQVFWDTFCDLKYKALECREIHGVWGNFVAFWYDIFFTADIVKLGRLEYECRTYAAEAPYTWGDMTVQKGDPVLSIHIPSSGEPFDEEAQLASLRRAWAFFENKPLVCVCHSWLLYPGYEALWGERSNVRAFREMFDVIQSRDTECFDDAWRIFGRDYEKKSAQLPEKTSMQRAFKRHILGGGKFGDGFGVLIFDGEKILNQ